MKLRLSLIIAVCILIIMPCSLTAAKEKESEAKGREAAAEYSAETEEAVIEEATEEEIENAGDEADVPDKAAGEAPDADMQESGRATGYGMPDDAEAASSQPESSTVKIVAVGDNLIHQRIIDCGRKKDGSYNYDKLYANMTETLAEYDVRIINQEVILSPDRSLWAGYPSFASPLEVGDAVVKAGFNVITHATNHSWDKGKAGADATLAYWKSRDVLLTGMYSSEEEAKKITVGTYNGIKIAFLNYTYGLNGNCPSEKYYVNLIDEQKIKKDIAKAQNKADFVIVLPHWGIEYVNEPSAAQCDLAQKMADWGADLIIGTHPHVVQPVWELTAADGRKVPCFFSLGDFMGNMINRAKDFGGMASVTLEKDDNGVRISAYELKGVVIHINADDTDFTTYPLKDYTTEMAAEHYDNRNGMIMTKAWLVTEMRRIKAIESCK